MTIVTLPSLAMRFVELLGIEEWIYPQTPGMELPDPLVVFPKRVMHDTEDELIMLYPWHVDGSLISLDDPNDEHTMPAESNDWTTAHALRPELPRGRVR